MSTSTQIATKGVVFKLNPFPQDWTRETYDFTGWNTNPLADTIEYEDEALVSFDNDVTMYAMWQARDIPSVPQYTVSFNGKTSADIQDMQDSFWGLDESQIVPAV